jgi:hypothetical protein
MKLLFICEKIDSHLKYRLEQLESQNIEVECLILPTFTIYKNGKEEVIEIDNKLGFLEKSGALQSLAQTLKYKKLFESLGNYDSINIYKTVRLCEPYLENIRKISKSYFITVENASIKHSRQIKKLFEHAHCLLFNAQSQLERFEKEFGYDEKTLIARDSNHFLTLIDELEESKVEKFKEYLNLSNEKHLIYCDLGSDITQQKAFIDNLLKLPNKQLRETTFIFDPASSSIVDKEMLIEHLEDKRFDYLMPDSLLTEQQRAMLFKISQSTIVLPNSSEYKTLQPSFYIKNHIYQYGTTSNKSKYEKLDIFIDSYENFENAITFNDDSLHLINELTQKNRDIITKLYHPEICLKNYMKVLEIL